MFWTESRSILEQGQVNGIFRRISVQSPIKDARIQDLATSLFCTAEGKKEME